MPQISTCLWFDDKAGEAAKFYASLFDGSKIGRTALYGKSAAAASGRMEGSVMTVEFELLGRRFLALNGGPAFKFSPALSLFVWLRTEKELDRLWAALSSGGKARMELAKHPWSPKYGWTADSYGLDWQLMLSPDRGGIAPAILFVGPLLGRGEEAVNFYASSFKGSGITFINRNDEKKFVNHCVFTLEGLPFVLMEGEGVHDFSFSEAFSFVVACDGQREVDRHWARLSDGGSEGVCGWLKDKFGVSWQVVPAELGGWAADPEKSEDVMREIIKMRKLDVAALKKAAGEG